jgi:hypothetical protein
MGAYCRKESSYVITIPCLYVPGSDDLAILSKRKVSLYPFPCQDTRDPMNVTLPHPVKGNLVYLKPGGLHLCTFYWITIPPCNYKHMRHSVPSGIGREQKRQAGHWLKFSLRDFDSYLFLHFSDSSTFYCLAGLDFSAKAVVFACTKPGLFEAQENFARRIPPHQKTQRHVSHNWQYITGLHLRQPESYLTGQCPDSHSRTGRSRIKQPQDGAWGMLGALARAVDEGFPLFDGSLINLIRAAENDAVALVRPLVTCFP